MIRNIRRFGFPAALIALATVAAVTFGSLRRTRDALQWRHHTHTVIEHIERAQASILAAESLRRTFRLSHDRADFDRMNQQIRATFVGLDTIQNLTRDNRDQQKAITKLRPLVKQRVDVIFDGIELPEWEYLDSATRNEQRTRQLRGTELSKLITANFDVLRERELVLLDQRDQRAALGAELTQGLILYGGLLSMGLLAFFYFSLVVENRHRIKSQTDLQRSNAIVKGVLDGTSDAVAVKDMDGRYLLVNPAVIKNFRRRESEILGRTDGELIPNETGLGIMAADREIMRNAQVKTFEQNVRIDDERQWTFLSTKGPYRNAEGEVAGIIAISRDITERKQNEARVAAQNTERGEIIARLESQTAGLVAMAELAAQLHAAQGREETCRVIGEFARRLFGVGGELGLFDPVQSRIENAGQWGETQARNSFPPGDCCGLRTLRSYIGGVHGSPACRHTLETDAPRTCIPIVAQGEVLGLLQLNGLVEEGDRRHFLHAFTEQVGLALTNLKLREHLQNQAVRDPLTGLFNRRYLDDMFSRELSRATRKGAPLSVLMVDIDFFKRINDTHGHAAGDDVLRQVARYLASSVRREDIVCRYGGEEFALIMPELTPDAALERAEKLRRGLSSVYVEVQGRALGAVTASFGVAAYPGYGTTTCEALIAEADEGLYLAKGRGRDCVVAVGIERERERSVG
ncbi:MAG: diguanylate cyclase [Myxococcales bacterium]